MDILSVYYLYRHILVLDVLTRRGRWTWTWVYWFISIFRHVRYPLFESSFLSIHYSCRVKDRPQDIFHALSALPIPNWYYVRDSESSIYMLNIIIYLGGIYLCSRTRYSCVLIFLFTILFIQPLVVTKTIKMR